MTLELTIPKIIQIICVAIMLFSWGAHQNISYEGRKIAKVIWGITLVTVWIFIMAGV